jgi:predicted dehydrogenase
MGPYHLTTLVSLLGPVALVQASGQIGFAERLVTTPGSSLLGQRIKVETLTSVQALLEFHSGAQVTFLASWDVWKHSVQPIELHGQKASLRIPDPNWFGGDLHLARGRNDWVSIRTRNRTFGKPNWPRGKAQYPNYRGLGLADMARGIVDNRSHRASGDVALHVLAIMECILSASVKKECTAVEPICARPDPLSDREGLGLCNSIMASPLTRWGRWLARSGKSP